MKKGRMAVAVLALAVSQVWSATITWNTPSDISAGQDTLTNQVFAAVNGGGASTVLNGINFKSDAEQSSIVIGGGTYANFIGTDINSTVPVVSQAYYDILKPAHYSLSSVTLKNLAVGQEYFVQLWVNDCRGSSYDRYTVIKSVSGSGTTNLVTLKTSANQSPASLGQFVVGSFTADAATQQIDIIPAAGAPGDNPVVNAVALYFAVPPPEATITWDTPENISGSADFTSNEVYAALNVGGSALTAEGIDFSADDGSLATLTVSGTGESGLIPSASSTVPSVSSEYATLLDSAKDASAIALSGLSAGQQYLVKIWSTDARTAGIGKTATVDGVSVDENVPDAENGLGQYAVGSFVALAAEQPITVSGDINAVEVYLPFPPDKTSPAAVEWDYARNVSSNVDTLTNTVFAALNGAGDTSVTLDGITFTTNAEDLITVVGTGYNNFIPAASGSGTIPPVSNDYLTLLDTAYYNASSLILSNLTVGQEYVIQAWTTDARGGIGDNRHTLVGGVKLWENVKAENDSLGQFVLGRFTAVSNMQFVVIEAAGVEAADHAVINAVVVYEGTTEFAAPPTDTPYDPAPIDWDTPQWVSADEDVISTQTLVKAVNVGGGSTETTINGVTFGVDDGSADGNAHTDFLGGETTSPVVSPVYQALLRPGRWSGHGIHLTGLTRGNSYTIQIWANDSRFDPSNGRAVEMLDVDGNAVSGQIHENDVATPHSLGQYIIGTFIAAGEVQDIFYHGVADDGDAVINGYALYDAPLADQFAEWAGSYGLSGADADENADPDNDGASNLSEYGLGGDPTNPGDIGTKPLYSQGATEMQYIYVARTDDVRLDYYLEINTDLIYGAWTNMGYSSVSGPSGTPDWDSVTNTVPADVAEKFIRLIIKNN